jgi:hypothetical protein
MKTIKTITTILMISVANFIYAETIGLKLGYVAFDTNSWNPDIYINVFTAMKSLLVTTIKYL